MDNNDTTMHFSSQGELDEYNNNLVETTIKLVGDRTAIAQTVQLLAYIRHAIRNNQQQTIQLNISNTVANIPYMMEVNGREVPDLVTVNKVQIN